ncbi:MAG: CBASS cGAMP-activated phospholipase [Candidatus Binatia bacterium]
MAAGEFWILALSGGGARGLFTANVLAQMEKEINEPLADHFDLIAGTSVGGILALGLAKEIPANQLVDLFDHISEIFAPKCWWPVFRAKYRNNVLKELLEESFGNTTIGDLKHRVMIPSVNYTKGTPSLFKTPHNERLRIDWEYHLVDVALATAAAPTYFPVYSFADQHFVDGGLVANAPGLTAVHEALHFVGHSDVNTIHVVSVGTAARGTAMDPSINPDMGIFATAKRYWPWGLGLKNWPTSGWGGRLFDLTINSQEAMSNSILKHWLKDRHHLIDVQPHPEQTNYLSLDNTSDEAKKTLRGQAAVTGQNFLTPSLIQQIREHQPISPNFYYGPNKNTSAKD